MTFFTLLLAATFTRPFERVVSMDPILMRSTADAHAILLVYETPLAIDYAARPYKVIPLYAELPDVSADGLTYRFRVRENRSAEDMARSLKRLFDPAGPNQWVVRDVRDIRVVGTNSVEIALKRPVSYFPWLMTLAPTAITGPNGEGTGPYRLVKWRKNYEMVFERREKDERHFDTIRYLIIDDLTTQWLMFLKGEVDYLGERARDNWDLIMDDRERLWPHLAEKGIRLYSIPTLEFLYVGMNLKDPVLGPNKKLRQALNCAFDYPAWEAFHQHRVAECSTPVPPGIEGRLETPFPYRFDLEKARRLLREAGYPEGIDPKTGRRLVLHLAIGRVDQSSRALSELLASFYAKIGIKLEIDYMPWDAFLKSVNEGRVQLFRMGWVADYPDPQNFLQLFYGPYRAPGINHTSYENPAYDAAYEAGDYRKCQEILQEDCPCVLTHYHKEYSLVGPRVKNFILSDFPYGYEQYYENALP